LPAAGAPVAARLRGLKALHSNLRTGNFFLQHLDEALSGGVPGCQGGRVFFNIDHRGHASKCLEFRQPGDRAGEFARERPAVILERLHALQAANRCQACWYASRGEVEALYTFRGFVGGLAALVRT
jgi:hypothetical protein